MQKILQLAYVSFAKKEVDNTIDQEIDAILAKASRFNKAHDITGILLYKSGVFLQLLEGDKNKLINLYGKIASDNRHGQISLLVKQFSEKRLYPEWSMAFKKVTEPDTALINEILPWTYLMEETKNRRSISQGKVMDLIKCFQKHLV